jgi:hypothetical protein
MATGDTIRDIISQAVIDALKDREDELRSIAEAGGAKAGGGLLGDIGTLSGIIGTVLEALLILDPPAEVALQVVKEAEGQGGHLGSGFGIGYMLGYAGWQMFQPALLPLQQKIATLFQTQQIEPEQAAQLVAMSILSLQDGRNKAHEMNVSDDNFDDMVDAATTRPDVVTALTMRNRDLIGDTDLDVALQRHGYNELWRHALIGLRRQLLSPADLALAVLKAVLDEDAAREYAKQLGYTDDDFTVMLGNTGEPPGIMELLEAYRREFIDAARLKHGVLQSRLRPEWLDVIEKLRYSPMTTADAARAVVENYMSDDEGAVIAQQNGLLPEHWRFIVESWGRPLSHEQMMTLYHRGKVTLDEVHQAFRESDLKDKYIDQAVELGRTLIPDRLIVQAVEHGVMDKAVGLERLKERGYDPADAELLFALGVASRTTSHKTLSKGDILAMYADALMNREQAVKHLADIGYDQTDAGQMLDLADYKRKAALLKTTQRGIEASLKAHHISESQAVQALTTAGLDHAQAQTLVDEWLQQRGIVTRTLTEAQTIKAVADTIITPDDGRTRLKALGYSETDIDILYMDKGIIPLKPAWTPPSS